MKNRIEKFLPLTVLVGLLAIGSLCAFEGCRSTPAQVSYKVAGATETTVELAMGGWNDYVKKFHPPLEQERQVKAGFEAYQKAALAFLDARALAASLGTNAPASVDIQAQATLASQSAEAALANLIALIRSFSNTPATNTPATPPTPL